MNYSVLKNYLKQKKLEQWYSNTKNKSKTSDRKDTVSKKKVPTITTKKLEVIVDVPKSKVSKPEN